MDHEDFWQAIIVPDAVGAGVRRVRDWDAVALLIAEQEVPPNRVLWPDGSYLEMVEVLGNPPQQLADWLLSGDDTD